MKYSDGSSETIKSCGIFNKELENYSQLDEKTRQTIEAFVNENSYDGKIVSSYKVKLSDEDENNVFYDSLSQKVSEDGSSFDSNSNSKINVISKILLILMVLCELLVEFFC